jgi:alpha-1,6-mannosyltransferase
MSAGLPVVVPDEGGVAELVDDDCGETYTSLDASDCARAIARILARDATSLRTAALDAAARLPNVQEQFAKTFDAYRALLSERRRANA